MLLPMLLVSMCLAADSDPLEVIAGHIAHGRYDEAEEAIGELPPEQRQSWGALRLRLRLQVEQSRYDEAFQLLKSALESQPDRARISAELGRLELDRGNPAEALRHAERALALDTADALARFVQAEAWAAVGDLKKAGEGYRWFVRYYNRVQPTDADTLLLVAEGSAQYARWKSVSQIFSFVVNTLCEDALKDDPSAWQSHWVAGRLLVEKFNRQEGLPELAKALAINPHAAEVHITLAAAALQEMQFEQTLEHLSRGLAIAPRHATGLRLKAEAQYLQAKLGDAEATLALALKERPNDQQSLALAAFLRTLDGDDLPLDRLKALLASLDRIGEWKSNGSRFEAIVIELAKQNPRPGYFLTDLGRLFETQRKHAHAEACYQQAVNTMPQLSLPKSELGLLYLQMGRNDDARRLLDDAFKNDPFHVRVSNMRKVLKVLDDYATIQTPHFVIRVDSQLDGLLASYMAEELEDVYARVTKEYGFEPPQRTQIEIYNKSKGLSGHQWFSARMTGLPWLQTIGASTGLIIALTSPTATEQPFNWARVLRHEFVHVVTLQQTEFNIPHWFTEALATRAEGSSMPASWIELLKRRVPKGQLRNLDNIHLGFQRAESKDDWDFAYCQSVLYAEYFVETYGADALAKLLEAYRGTRSTDVALLKAFGVKKSDVEAGYLEFLKRRVAELGASESDEPLSDEAIAAAHAENPNDLAARSAYAELKYRRKRTQEAEELARDVLKERPDDVRAAMVLARLNLDDNDRQAAEKILLAAYDPDHPNPRLWLLLAKVRYDSGNVEGALAIYRRGQTLYPRDAVWSRGVAQCAESTKDTAALKAALEQMAILNIDDASSRKRRGELALEESDFEAAVRYGRMALEIDVLDAEIHVLLARGFRGLKEHRKAAREFEAVCQLLPGKAEHQLAWAEELIATQQWEAARVPIEAVLKAEPENAVAKALLAKLKSKP